MIKILLLGTLLITLFKDSFCSDSYSVGENLFIWAPNGLRLRSEPNSKSKIITILNFGKKVTIIEKTNLNFNVYYNSEPWIDTSNNKVDPIILYGNWVKVSVDSNLVGYVIDQYLLAIKPNGNRNEGALKPIKIDTISKLENLPDGNHSDLVIKKTYNNEIIGIETVGENWGGSTYTFPAFTIEEVLVFFFYSMQAEPKYSIESNKKDEIIFTDHSCIEIIIKHIGGDTLVESLGGC